MLPHEVWAGNSPKAKAVRALVTPLSWLYALGWQAYLAVYAAGLKKAASPHRPIICIGSLVVGGSGKSPVTMHVAKVLQSLGKEVVIGCSGYGSPKSEAASIPPPGPLSAAEWGDEPAMIRWLLPEVPIVVGRRRVLAAQLVQESFPNAALLMDDGFQHLPLAKHLSVVLDEAAPRNTRCLPAGPYREPRRNRRRANLVIPGKFSLKRHPIRIVTTGGMAVDPKEYGVLCALGDPDRFCSALADSYPNLLTPAPVCILPDHDPLASVDLWDSFPSGLPIVVTAKDWVKLRERPDISNRNVLIALQEVELEPGPEFAALLVKSFDE